jgi:hypothetical protein
MLMAALVSAVTLIMIFSGLDGSCTDAFEVDASVGIASKLFLTISGLAAII